MFYENYEVSMEHIVFLSDISKRLNDPSKMSLIVGKDNNQSTKLAKSFAFSNYITFQDYFSEREYLCPCYKYEKRDGITELNNYKEDNLTIDQIIIYSFNYDWLCLCQVLVDLLRSDGIASIEHESIKQKVNVYIMNNNITDESEYDIPRFSTGAFGLCLKSIYKVCTGRDIDIIPFEKPELGLFEMCEDKMKSQGFESGDDFYIIDKNNYESINSYKNKAKNWKAVDVSGIDKESDIVIAVKRICEENGVNLNL